MAIAPSIEGLTAEDCLQQPHGFLSRLRSNAPVAYIPEMRLFAVSRYDLVCQVAARTDDFLCSLRTDTDVAFGNTAVEDVLSSADSPKHERHRRAIFPWFSRRHVDGITSTLAETARDCAERLLARPGEDWMPDLSIFPALVLARIMGFPNEDAQMLSYWGRMGNQIMGEISLIKNDRERVALMARIHQSLAPIQDYVQAHLEQALRHPHDDILTHLARAADEGRMSWNESVAMATAFIGSSTDTPVGLLGSAVRLLGENPAMQATLRTDPQLLDAFIDEVLRLESPLRGTVRRVARPTTLKGFDLAADQYLLLMWDAANRDPEVFADPDQLDIFRPNVRQQIGFGRGIHTCLGGDLARAQARALLASLLTKSAGTSLVCRPGRLRYIPSVVIRRLSRLTVDVVPEECAATPAQEGTH